MLATWKNTWNTLHVLFIAIIQRSCSVAKLCPTLCDPMDCSMPGSTILHYLLEFAKIHVHWVDDAILPFHPLAPPSPPPALNLSQHQNLFQSALCIRWPKYWSFSFSISPSHDYLGLISFRMDWLDLLGVHGTLKSLLQHHNLKASVLWCLAFFMVQLSCLYMTTGKTIVLTIRTFVGKEMFLFNRQSRFVIAFLPRSKCLLISWL